MSPITKKIINYQIVFPSIATVLVILSKFFGFVTWTVFQIMLPLLVFAPVGLAMIAVFFVSSVFYRSK
jgi:hypothetical protein